MGLATVWGYVPLPLSVEGLARPGPSHRWCWMAQCLHHGCTAPCWPLRAFAGDCHHRRQIVPPLSSKTEPPPRISKSLVPLVMNCKRALCCRIAGGA